MPTRLIFGQPRYTGGPVHLVFGAGPGVVTPDPLQVTVVVQLDDVAVSALATYDNRNPRRASASVLAEHQVASRADLQQNMPHGLSSRAELPGRLPWEFAQPAGGSTDAGWASPARVSAELGAAWSQGATANSQWAMVHQQSVKLHQQVDVAWELAASKSQAWRFVHQQAGQLTVTAAAKWQAALSRSSHLAAVFGRGAQRDRSSAALWQVARPAPPGRTAWVPVDPGGVTPHEPSTHLVFACPRWLGGPAHLVFGRTCRVVGVVVPIQRRYEVINDVSVRRTADNMPVRVDNLRVSLDYRSWTWSFSASVDLAHADAVLPGTGLSVELNGQQISVVVESWERDRAALTDRSLRVAGRGANLYLDKSEAVRSFYNSAPATANQLADAALTVNGQATEFSVDWGLTDWLVPAGGFAHSGTPMSALLTIAAAVGGYVRPHPYLPRLDLVPVYPVLPWAWSTVDPDFTLPAAVAVTESVVRLQKPNYNGVTVRGEAGGVEVFVRRAGTAGEVEAPMVVDPLITDKPAGDQRGAYVLADTGAQIELGLRMPVLPSTGIIMPGSLVSYNDGDQDYMGLVRSVVLEASFPELWQIIGVETHA